MSRLPRRLLPAAALAATCLLATACGTHIHTGAVLPSGRAAIAQAAHNAVSVSPLPGTSDASPRTEISFLGPRGLRILKIDVVGSKSNYHAGRLKAYANGLGESFLPAKAFKSGETVAAYAMVSSDGHRWNVGTIFRVAGGRQGAEPGVSRVPARLHRHLPANAQSLAPLREYPTDPVKVMRGREGTDWVLISERMQPQAGGHAPAAAPALTDTVLEQVDARTGLVMWEWHALGHLPRAGSPTGKASAEGQLRRLEIRSVQERPGGSVRLQTATSGAIELSLHTGALEGALR